MRISGTESDVYRQAASTIASSGSLTDIGRIDVNGNQVTIDVTDPATAPGAAQFEADLADELGPNVKVNVK